MNIDNIARSLKNSVLTYPFDEVTRVYKVENRMFMLCNCNFTSITVKNHPDKNYMLRTTYEYITVGYHMNKEHWITIDLSSDYDTDLVEALIIESYQIVISNLSAKIRAQYIEEL